jgi:hypothetical protein
MFVIEDGRMNPLKIEIKGVPEAVIKAKLLEDKVRGNIKVGMTQAAMIVQAEAKRIIGSVMWVTKGGVYRGFGKNKRWYPPGSAMRGHKRSGDLARSIQVKTGWASQYEIVGVVGTDQKYAPYVEALPDGGFLNPALRNKGAEALKHVERAVEKACAMKDADNALPPESDEGGGET